MGENRLCLDADEKYRRLKIPEGLRGDNDMSSSQEGSHTEMDWGFDRRRQGEMGRSTGGLGDLVVSSAGISF